MGHLENATLNIAVEEDISTWAMLIVELKRHADSIGDMKDKFPDDALGLKVDVIVRLLGDLAEKAEEKRAEASRKVTEYYEKHRDEVEKAISDLLIEQERLNELRLRHGENADVDAILAREILESDEPRFG